MIKKSLKILLPNKLYPLCIIILFTFFSSQNGDTLKDFSHRSIVARPPDALVVAIHSGHTLVPLVFSWHAYTSVHTRD